MDKGYDVKSTYNTGRSVYGGEAFIPLNMRGAKVGKTLPAGNPVCEAGPTMHKGVKPPATGAPVRKSTARSVSPKSERVPVIIRTGITEKRTVATPNTESLSRITGFP